MDKSRINTIDEWLINIMGGQVPGGKKDDKVLVLIAFTAWMLWKGRCKAIFKESKVNPQRTTLRSMNAAREYSRIQDENLQGKSPLKVPANSQKWATPTKGVDESECGWCL